VDLIILSAAFFQGLGSSLHCIGMCGPLSISCQKQSTSKWKNSLLYNLGRFFSYSFLGFILGYTGKSLNFAGELAGIQQVSFILAFLVLVFFGLSLIFPSLQTYFSLSQYIQRPIVLMFGRVRTLENPNIQSLSIGTLSGFLPCGVLYPAYALAFGTGDFFLGGVVMSVFFLGTFPALFLFGVGYHTLKMKLSNKLLPVFGVVILIFGMTSLYMRSGIGKTHCHTEQHK